MKNEYFKLITMVERLHRTHLSLMSTHLRHMRITDVSDVQAIILCNLGSQELTVGELTTRGCYSGTNVSHNLKTMVKNGYVIHTPSFHDHRASHVRLTEKALDLVNAFDEIFCEYIEELLKSCISSKDMMKDVNCIYSFWNDVLNRKKLYQYGQ